MMRTQPVRRLSMLLPLGSALSAATVGAQSTSSLAAALQRVAGPYPVQAIQWFSTDSARIIVEDSSFTGSRSRPWSMDWWRFHGDSQGRAQSPSAGEHAIAYR